MIVNGCCGRAVLNDGIDRKIRISSSNQYAPVTHTLGRAERPNAAYIYARTRWV